MRRSDETAYADHTTGFFIPLSARVTGAPLKPMPHRRTLLALLALLPKRHRAPVAKRHGFIYHENWVLNRLISTASFSCSRNHRIAQN